MSATLSKAGVAGFVTSLAAQVLMKTAQAMVSAIRSSIFALAILVGEAQTATPPTAQGTQIVKAVVNATMKTSTWCAASIVGASSWALAATSLALTVSKRQRTQASANVKRAGLESDVTLSAAEMARLSMTSAFALTRRVTGVSFVMTRAAQVTATCLTCSVLRLASPALATVNAILLKPCALVLPAGLDSAVRNLIAPESPTAITAESA